VLRICSDDITLWNVLTTCNSCVGASKVNCFVCNTPLWCTFHQREIHIIDTTSDPTYSHWSAYIHNKGRTLGKGYGIKCVPVVFPPCFPWFPMTLPMNLPKAISIDERCNLCPYYHLKCVLFRSICNQHKF
jgi:hypothetical protein